MTSFFFFSFKDRLSLEPLYRFCIKLLNMKTAMWAPPKSCNKKHCYWTFKIILMSRAVERNSSCLVKVSIFYDCYLGKTWKVYITTTLIFFPKYKFLMYPYYEIKLHFFPTGQNKNLCWRFRKYRHEQQCENIFDRIKAFSHYVVIGYHRKKNEQVKKGICQWYQEFSTMWNEEKWEKKTQLTLFSLVWKLYVDCKKHETNKYNKAETDSQLQESNLVVARGRRNRWRAK